jgi:threonyl-tRNA synthetase
VVGRREAEEGKVALRRLGSDRQEIASLSEAAKTLALEALPPDLAIRAEREIGLSDFPREP